MDPPADLLDQLHALMAALPEWPPGRWYVRFSACGTCFNVAAVPDVLEAEILESYVPLVVLLQEEHSEGRIHPDVSLIATTSVRGRRPGGPPASAARPGKRLSGP